MLQIVHNHREMVMRVARQTSERYTNVRGRRESYFLIDPIIHLRMQSAVPLLIHLSDECHGLMLVFYRGVAKWYYKHESNECVYVDSRHWQVQSV